MGEKGTMGTGWGEQYRWERGEKGTDEGRKEGRRALIWGGREGMRDTKGQMGRNVQGRSEGRRKGKIYWWPLTKNIHAPSHPPSLTTRRLSCCVDVQRMVLGNGGAFQDLARYLSGLQT